MTALEIIFFCYPCLLLAIRILCEKLQLDMSIEILILILILIPINIYAAFQFKINKKKERVAKFYTLLFTYSPSVAYTSSVTGSNHSLEQSCPGTSKAM